VTLSLYDTLGRSTTTTLNYASGLTDPALNRSHTTAYNAVSGRVTGQQDPLGRWVSQQYDLLGRVTKTIQNCVGGSPPATCTGSVTVDQNVATQSAYDTLNRTTYDGLGRTLKTIRNYQDGVYSSSAPATDVATSYRYDALGRTLAVTDTLGKATTLTVNTLGQTVSTTDPLGRVTTMGYDGTGTLRWTKRLDGQITLYQIDGLGRTSTTILNYKDGVVGTSEPADTDLTTRTVYDAAGRRLQTRVKTSATTERISQFAYDGLDRLIGVTENYQSSG
jgi:YD repeat-containing protein